MELPTQKPDVTSYAQKCKRNSTNRFEFEFEFFSVASLLGKPRERDHWGDLGVDRWTILGRISRRWDVGIWTGLGWPRVETGGGGL